VGPGLVGRRSGAPGRRLVRGCPRAALLQLAGVYRAEPGEDGHGTAATPLGGFLDRIAETIAQADTTAS